MSEWTRQAPTRLVVPAGANLLGKARSGARTLADERRPSLFLCRADLADSSSRRQGKPVPPTPRDVRSFALTSLTLSRPPSARSSCRRGSCQRGPCGLREPREVHRLRLVRRSRREDRSRRVCRQREDAPAARGHRLVCRGPLPGVRTTRKTSDGAAPFQPACAQGKFETHHDMSFSKGNTF